jgi:hypothetical protein
MMMMMLMIDADNNDNYNYNNYNNYTNYNINNNNTCLDYVAILIFYPFENIPLSSLFIHLFFGSLIFVLCLRAFFCFSSVFIYLFFYNYIFVTTIV